MTLENLIRTAASRLIDHGYVHGSRETDLIAAQLFNQDSAWLMSHYEDEVDQQSIDRLLQAVEDRLNGKPLAYILGSQQFMGWEFLSDSRALIPRPETEQLTELMIRSIRQNGWEYGNILEIGTGSGVISISLKKYFPETTITATDISEEALELAEDNARRLKVEIHFQPSDLFNNLPKQKYDLIVANLPYVPTGKLAFVSDQILDWEPMIAIDAGDDGLKYIEPLLKNIKDYLSPNAIIGLEVWHTHREAITALIDRYLPGSQLSIEKDLAGFDRFAVITAPDA